MQRFLAILLLSTLFYSEGRLILIHVDYLVNYTYISQELCVNKEEPKSTCNGNCHVMAQIQQPPVPEEREQPMPTYEYERPLLLLNELWELPEFVSLSSRATNHFSYQFAMSEGTPKCLDHPPQRQS